MGGSLKYLEGYIRSSLAVIMRIAPNWASVHRRSESFELRGLFSMLTEVQTSCGVAEESHMPFSLALLAE